MRHIQCLAYAVVLLTVIGARCAAGTATVDWVSTFSSGGLDAFNDLAVDSDGNIYVVGASEGSEAGQNLGGADAIVVKYSPTGARLASVQFGTSADDDAWDVACDADGYLYVLCHTDGDFDGPSAGESDFAVAKFTPSLSMVWKRQFGSAEPEYSGGIAVAPNGHIWFCGVTDGRVFGETPAEIYEESIVVEMGPNGDVLQAVQLQMGGSMDADEMAVDTAGNLYLTGEATGVFNNLALEGDAFIAKFSPSLNLLWGWQFAGPEAGRAGATAVMPSGGVAVVGIKDIAWVYGRTETDFISRFGSDGSQLWMRTTSPLARAGASATVVDHANRIYIGGIVSSGLFGPNLGQYDIYAVSFDAAGEELWHYQAGSVGDDYICDVRLSAGGKLLAVGVSDGGLFGMPIGQQHAFLIQLS
ncbi:MAG: hypothetical protein IT209_02110, partial [Armatimonadetes bacterium]|nr:hypothetical protein [Armatimonadota bacterium]